MSNETACTGDRERWTRHTMIEIRWFWLPVISCWVRDKCSLSHTQSGFHDFKGIALFYISFLQIYSEPSLQPDNLQSNSSVLIKPNGKLTLSFLPSLCDAETSLVWKVCLNICGSAFDGENCPAEWPWGLTNTKTTSVADLHATARKSKSMIMYLLWLNPQSFPQITCKRCLFSLCYICARVTQHSSTEPQFTASKMIKQLNY